MKSQVKSPEWEIALAWVEWLLGRVTNQNFILAQHKRKRLTDSIGKPLIIINMNMMAAGKGGNKISAERGWIMSPSRKQPRSISTLSHTVGSSKISINFDYLLAPIGESRNQDTLDRKEARKQTAVPFELEFTKCNLFFSQTKKGQPDYLLFLSLAGLLMGRRSIWICRTAYYRLLLVPRRLPGSLGERLLQFARSKTLFFIAQQDRWDLSLPPSSYPSPFTHAILVWT